MQAAMVSAVPLRRRRSLARSALTGSDRRAVSLSPRRRLAHPADDTDAETHTEARTSNATARVRRDELVCPICFDMLCFPVTLPCGHNFDRGCLLTAWEHEELPSLVDHDVPLVSLPTHACPLCRQRTATANGDDLHVNLLLKKLISAQFPLEIQGLECEEKCHATSITAAVAASPAPSERRRRTWRTAASFFYVWLASVTEPSGFILAVLLLLSLVAIAVTPQQMLTNASTLPTIFEGLDHILNAFLLLVREIAIRMDQLEDLWPWMQVFSFIPRVL